MVSSQRRTLETTAQSCNNQLRATIKVLWILKNKTKKGRKLGIIEISKGKEWLNRPCYSTIIKRSFYWMHSLFYVLLPLLLCWGASVGHHVMTTPAPHTGLAVVTALNILEGFNITSQMLRNSTYHRTAEVIQIQCPDHNTAIFWDLFITWVLIFALISQAVKIALALASGLGDPMYEDDVPELVAKMLR